MQHLPAVAVVHLYTRIRTRCDESVPGALRSQFRSDHSNARIKMYNGKYVSNINTYFRFEKLFSNVNLDTRAEGLGILTYLLAITY